MALIGAKKNFTKPHDGMYGVLGIISHADKDHINVDYEIPLEKLFLKACQVALRTEPELEILRLGFKRGDGGKLPTWCPNFPETDGSRIPMPHCYSGT